MEKLIKNTINYFFCLRHYRQDTPKRGVHAEGGAVSTNAKVKSQDTEITDLRNRRHIPHVGRSTTTEEFAHSTRENLQIAFELARRNLSERTNKQKANNSKLPPIPEFTPGQKVLVYKSHHSTDGPNSKLIQPWRGPYIICSKLSPVVYRIRRPEDTKQVSVHLAHIKSYRPRQSAPVPDFHKLEELILGRRCLLLIWKNLKRSRHI